MSPVPLSYQTFTSPYPLSICCLLFPGSGLTYDERCC